MAPVLVATTTELTVSPVSDRISFGPSAMVSAFVVSAPEDAVTDTDDTVPKMLFRNMYQSRLTIPVLISTNGLCGFGM